VESGELVSVLGAPSSGKTRLALELAFLLKPEGGKVLFRGTDPLERKRFGEKPGRPLEITMLVQNAEDQLFARTVFDDVAFGPRHLSLSDEQIKARVIRAIQAVRLNPDQVCDRSPFALSGGEKRRVALAGVLSMEPEVLILDEPTANLDPQTTNEFLQLLEPLRNKSAIVWFTVRAKEAALAQRVYLLRDGRTREVTGGDELFDDWEELARAGVELPSIYELAYSLEARGCPIPSTGSPAALESAIVALWRQRHD
jgi:energy-coupling factor transporter ATP-binding protein EcfA2